MSTANSNDDGCARVCARAPFSASAGGVGRCRNPVKLTFLRDSGPLLAVEVILLHIHVASVVHTWRSAMGMQERVCCTPKSLLLRTHSTRPRPELLDTPLRSAGHRDLDAARAARGRRAQAGRGRGGRVLEHKGGRAAQVPALQRRVLVRGGRGRGGGGGLAPEDARCQAQLVGRRAGRVNTCRGTPCPQACLQRPIQKEPGEHEHAQGRAAAPRRDPSGQAPRTPRAAAAKGAAGCLPHRGGENRRVDAVAVCCRRAVRARGGRRDVVVVDRDAPTAGAAERSPCAARRGRCTQAMRPFRNPSLLSNAAGNPSHNPNG
jgi:hypothetical protein